jgi:hypothetical protein
LNAAVTFLAGECAFYVPLMAGAFNLETSVDVRQHKQARAVCGNSVPTNLCVAWATGIPAVTAL